MLEDSSIAKAIRVFLHAQFCDVLIVALNCAVHEMSEPVYLQPEAVCLTVQCQDAAVEWLPALHIPAFQDFNNFIRWEGILSHNVPLVVLPMSLCRLLELDQQLEYKQLFENVFDELSLFDK